MTVVQVGETVGWVFGEPVTKEMLAAFLEHHAPPATVGDDPTAASRWAARAVMTAMLTSQEASRRGLASESELPPAVADELVGNGAPPDAEVQAFSNATANATISLSAVACVMCSARLRKKPVP